jgi:AcrR family transcriptional regulator
MTKDEIVKQEIILKAQGLFQQFGLKKTTMDEIAFACGKAKSTLYHYFKSKEEVFEEVLKMEVTNLRKVVKSQVDEVKTIKEKLMAYFVAFHTGVVNKLNLYRTLKIEIDGRLTHLSLPHKKQGIKPIKRFIDFEANYVARILYDAYDSAEFTKIDKEDIPFFSEILVAAFLGVMSYTIETDALINKEKLRKTADMLISQVFS